MRNRLIDIGFTVGLMMFASAAMAEIYKTVDENGNVIYTDQKPASDARPIDLPELNVAEPHRPIRPAPSQTVEDEGDPWRGFSIRSPAPEENIWGTGSDLTVELELPQPLGREMSIVVYLDGEAQEPVRDPEFEITDIERGEHEIRAELLGRAGRLLASTESVTFYMKQSSTNFPARRRN